MQQVNLLPKIVHGKRDVLDGFQLGLVWCALVVVLVGLSGWQGVHYWRLEDRAQRLGDELAAIDAQLTQQRYNIEQAPRRLRDRINSLNEQVGQRQVLLQLLQQRRNSGFSGHLVDLAKSRIDGLWLDEIRLSAMQDLQVHLGGETVDPVNVPRFLQNLAAQTEFAGQRFQHFQLSVDEEDQLARFAITSPESADSG